MHRFYFHLHECGESTLAEEGLVMASFEAAFQEAIRAARSLMSSDVGEGRLCRACHIEITDSYGITLATVPFTEALTIEP